MKQLRGITFEVTPLDNGGYVVGATATVRADEGYTSSGPLPYGLTPSYSGSVCNQSHHTLYAPDSQHVGMAIQQIIDDVNVSVG